MHKEQAAHAAGIKIDMPLMHFKAELIEKTSIDKTATKVNEVGKAVEKAVTTKEINAIKTTLSPHEIIKKYSDTIKEITIKWGDEFKEITLPLPDAEFIHHVLDRHFPGGSNLIDKKGLTRSIFNAKAK